MSLCMYCVRHGHVVSGHYLLYIAVCCVQGIAYWRTGKNRYQMEVPEAALKHVPEEYELMSSKKDAKRYRTKTMDNFLAELVDAEERKDAALKDIMRRIFHSFDERYGDG